MNKYRILPLQDPIFGNGHEIDIFPIECEWETYTGGHICAEGASVVVINTEMRDDPEYPEGFHEAHLCQTHMDQARPLYE